MPKIPKMSLPESDFPK